MFRAIPSVNKLLSKRQRERDDEKLCGKLREIKKSESAYNFRVNDKVKIYKRIAFNDVTRNLEIRRENLILAKKIKDMSEQPNPGVLKSKSTRAHLKSHTRKLSPIDSYAKTGPNTTTSGKFPHKLKSLNQEKRKKELILKKIEEE